MLMCVFAFMLVCVCLQMCDWLCALVHFTLHCQLLVLLLPCGIISVQMFVALPLCMLLLAFALVHQCCFVFLLVCILCCVVLHVLQDIHRPGEELVDPIADTSQEHIFCCCHASACVLPLCVHV